MTRTSAMFFLAVGLGLAAWAGADDGAAVEVVAAPPAPAANPSDHGQAGRMILREVFESILTKDYRDRAATFIDVLLEYLETPVKEQRHPVRPGTRRPIVPVRR